MRSPKLLVSALLFAGLLLLLPYQTYAKDEWLQVRSKNFFLVGNAAEKDIRRVATKMEQFRETFRQLFRTMNVNAAIPTNVVVFKSDSSYKPYKPKRADGKIDNFVAGYFQPGEDVNYITLSTEGTDADTFGTIFHEYVHFIINTNFGKSEVPPWFNEGLAEYYQTFEIEEDQKVKLGYPQGNHLELLRQNKLMALDALFKVDNYSLHQTGDHSRSVFYAQSWALIHYLVQTGKTDGLDKFLTAIFKNVPPEKAFQDAFQITYADMEKELRKYIAQASYRYNILTFKNKLLFDTQMQTAPLSDGDSKTYLADLLYHTNRADDAEPLLAAALGANPDSSMANTTLGMVKLRQRKWTEARAALEKALAQDHKNHIAYYQYAYLLSREGQDEFGYVKSFPAATAQKMCEMLKKAIAINPEYTESYELFAFINMVNDENYDESIAYLRKALQYQPGNQEYLLRAAEIYLRQEKLKEAEQIINKIAATADDPQIKQRAESLQDQMRQRAEVNARNRDALKQYDEAMAKRTGGSGPIAVRGDRPLSAEEMAKIEAEHRIRGINNSLRQPVEGEIRIVGSIQKIVCKGAKITYIIKSGAESFELSSKDFQGLTLASYDEKLNEVGVGCDTQMPPHSAVITYNPAPGVKAPVRGDLVALDFVPSDFRLMERTSEPLPATVIVDEVPEDATVLTQSSKIPTDEELDAMRRKSILESIKADMRKPLEGERRVLGTIERSECDKKGLYFHVKAGTEMLKLFTASPNTLQLKTFVSDVAGVQFGCNMKQFVEPAVFTFKAVPNPKQKTAGEIVAIEFVPKSFVLE